MKIPEKTENHMNFKIGFIQILPGKYGILADESVRGVIGGEFVHW